jgi:predicted unusual protein kinase regulating ubiquinone biosynthesis (AarF/ABC1/UbiB family)
MLDLQDLGLTFIKAAQMMSIQPDVLPGLAVEELRLLQDSVEPFKTPVAIALIEKELGIPLGHFFQVLVKSQFQQQVWYMCTKQPLHPILARKM